MRIYDVEQGSPEWFGVRLGIPTASEFDKIITAGGKASAQADAFANRLLAEIMTGKPVETFGKTGQMDRGNELEPQAAEFYQFQTDSVLRKVGFCTDDARTMGASPDRLVGDEGLLEIKCPEAHTHVQYLIDGKMDPAYRPQVQGQLLVTGRKWVDWLSYHPEIPPVTIRVERDNVYLFEMSRLIGEFTRKLQAKRKIMVDRGYIPESVDIDITKTILAC